MTDPRNNGDATYLQVYRQVRDCGILSGHDLRKPHAR